MKYIINKSLIVILGTLILSSCSEDKYLHVENPNQYSSDNYYNSEERAEEAVIAAYANIGGVGSYGRQLSYLFYALSDEIIHEQGWVNNMNITPFTDNVEDVWGELYKGIYRSNLALSEKVFKNEDISFSDEELKRRRIAEVKSLRALYNFYLTIIFNEPPLLKSVPQDLNKSFTNGKKEDFWAAIKADLYSAIPDLPLKSESIADEGYKGRIDKQTAQFLLGKVYMYTEQYDSAEIVFEEVINSGEYSLTLPENTSDSASIVNAYMCNFVSGHSDASKLIITESGATSTYKTEFNDESIFEIGYGSEDSRWNDWLPLWGMSGHLRSALFGYTGWRNLAPEREFVDTYFEDFPDNSIMEKDPRFYACVFTPGDTMDYRSDDKGTYDFSLTPFEPSSHILPALDQGYGLRKYVYPIWEGTGSPNNDPNNVRLFRYADLLLMHAEASYHAKGSGDVDGLASLNKVRTRAQMPAYTELSPENIMNERAVELAFEIVRWFDLIRWSQMSENPWVSSVTDYVPEFIEGKHEYMPIPQYEIDKMEGKLLQNPGY